MFEIEGRRWEESLEVSIRVEKRQRRAREDIFGPKKVWTLGWVPTAGWPGTAT